MIGQLFASGWHSCAMMMRMLADDVLNGFASLGSPGLKPVLVNDTLTYSARGTQKANSQSRPEIGLVFTQIEAVNQRAELVFSVVTKVFVERRSRFAG